MGMNDSYRLNIDLIPRVMPFQGIGAFKKQAAEITALGETPKGVPGSRSPFTSAGALNKESAAIAAEQATQLERLNSANSAFARSFRQRELAELRYQEVIGKSNASLMQIRSAESGVFAARQRSFEQLNKLTKEQEAYNAVLDRQAMIEKDLARAQRYRVLNTATRVGSYIGLGALAIGATTGYEAVKWNQQTMQLLANTNMSERERSFASRFALNLSAQTGAVATDVLTAYKHAVNEGYHFNAAKQIVTAAIKSALPSGAPVGDVANALAMTMRAFGIRRSLSTRTMDLVHTAANLANEDTGPFFQQFGRFASMAASTPMASFMGEPGQLYQALAGFSALSRVMRTNFSATQMLNLYSHIGRPTPAVQKVLADIYAGAGNNKYRRYLYSDFSYAGLQHRGLLGIMQDVARAHLSKEQIAELMPNLRGTQGFLALAGNQSKSARAIYDALLHSHGVTAHQYHAYANTTMAQARRLQQSLHRLAVITGEGVVPVFNRLASVMLPLVSGLSRFAGTGAGSAILATGVGIGAVSMGIRGAFALAHPFGDLKKLLFGGGRGGSGALTVGEDVAGNGGGPSVLARGFRAMGSAARGAAMNVLELAGNVTKAGIASAASAAETVGLKAAMLAEAAATKIAAAGQWLLNFAMDANPIGLAIVAVGALAAGFLYLYNNVKPFRQFVTTVFTDLKNVVTGAIGWLKGNWQKVIPDVLMGPFAPVMIFMQALGPKFLGFAGKMMTNFVDGIKNNIPLVSGAAQDAMSAVKHFLAFFSPNAAGDDPQLWGSNLGKAFADGVKSTHGKAYTAGEKVAEAAKKGAESKKSALEKAGHSAGGNFVSGFLSALSALPGDVGNILGQIGNRMPWSGGGGNPNFQASGSMFGRFGAVTDLNKNAPSSYAWGQNYSGSLWDTDYSSGGRVGLNVVLPGGRNAVYTFLGQKMLPGMGIEDLFRTANGGLVFFNHLMENFIGKVGQKVFGGTVIGQSGEPTSSQYGKGPHLCVVTDANGRAFLAEVSSGQMAQAKANGSALSGKLTPWENQHFGYLSYVANKNHIPLSSLLAVLQMESSGGMNPAAGFNVTQVTPAAWRAMGYKHGPVNWQQAVGMGAQYLWYMAQNSGGNWLQAFTSYNGSGPAAARYGSSAMAWAAYYGGLGPRPGGPAPSYLPHTGGGNGGNNNGWRHGPPAGSGPGATTSVEGAKAQEAKAAALWDALKGLNPATLSGSQRAQYNQAAYNYFHDQALVTIAADRKRILAEIAKDPSQKGVLMAALHGDIQGALGQANAHYQAVLQKEAGKKGLTAVQIATQAVAAAKTALQTDFPNGTSVTALEKLNGTQLRIWEIDEKNYLVAQEQLKIAQDRKALAAHLITQNTFNLRVAGAKKWLASQEGHIAQQAKFAGEVGPLNRAVTHESMLISAMKSVWAHVNPLTLPVSGNHGLNQTQWLKDQYKMHLLYREEADQKARIAYYEGKITYQQWQQIKAKEKEAENAQNAWSRQKLAGPAISGLGDRGSVTPVRMVGHCTAEKRKEAHARENGQHLKGIHDNTAEANKHLAQIAENTKGMNKRPIRPAPPDPGATSPRILTGRNSASRVGY